MPDETTTAETQTETAAAETAAKTFTQQDVDRIVQERLARAKTTPPADYDELKTKASRLDELENANRSEAEKSAARIAELERRNSEILLDAQEAKLRSAIVSGAAGKFADPQDAVALIDRASLAFDEAGDPTNIGDALTRLLEQKPHLGVGSAHAGSADQGARGGAPNQVTREQLRSMSDAEYVKARSEGRLTRLLQGGS